MGTRQYIGARYTTAVYQNSLNPSSAEWESGFAYEPLTLVTYNNSSYLSRKIVPANIGNPVDNPVYWVCTGYYNGQIMQLEQEISDINDRIDGVDDDISDVNDRVDDVIIDIDTIISKNNIKNKRIVTIGDSYDRTVNFTSKMSEYLGHGALTVQLGTNCWVSSDGVIVECARGGSGFTNNGGGPGSGNGFLDRLTEVAGLMTEADRKKVDIICVTGGINDAFYNTSDAGWASVGSGMQDFANYAKTNFPNAKLMLYYIGLCRAVNPSNITPDNAERNIFHYQNEAGIRGFGYITNAEYILRVTPSLLGSDGLHPSSGATNILASFLISGLVTGSVDCSWIPNKFGSFVKEAPASGGAQPFSVNVKNNIAYVTFDSLDLTFATPQAMAFTDFIKVGTASNLELVQDQVFKTGALFNVGGTWTYGTLGIKISGSDVYYANMGTTSGTTALNNVTAISALGTTTIMINTLNLA